MPHDPSWPLHLQVYVVVHFLLVLAVYHDVFERKMVRICHVKENVKSRGFYAVFCSSTVTLKEGRGFLFLTGTV